MDQPQGNWRLRFERGTRLLDFPAGHVFANQGEVPKASPASPGAETRRTMFTMAIPTPEKGFKGEATSEVMLLCKGECSLSYLAGGDSPAKSRSGQVLTNVMSGHIIRGASAIADCAEPFTVVSRTAVTVLAISPKLLQRLPKQLMTELRQNVLQQLQWLSSRAQEKLPIDDIWAALDDQGINVNQAGGNSKVIRLHKSTSHKSSVFANSVFLRGKGAVASCPLIEGLQ